MPSTLFYVGTGGTANIGASNVKYSETLSDGLHLKVYSNHGMYSVNNFVII